MTIDRIKHSYAVALKMQEIGKNLKLTEEQINELFILGFNHDIGYHFVNDNESHNKIGGELLKQSNYKYWEEVYYHGEIDINYSYKINFLDYYHLIKSVFSLIILILVLVLLTV